PAPDARRDGVPLALRHPLDVEGLREGALPLRFRRADADRRLRAGRVDDRPLRRELELAWPGLDAAQLSPHRGARALPPLLRRRAARRVPGGLGPGADAPGGRARAPGPRGPNLSGRRRRPPPLQRRRGTVHRGSRLARPGAVLRVLPRRDGTWPRRLAPDRLERAGAALRRGPGAGTHRRRALPVTRDGAERFWPRRPAPISRRAWPRCWPAHSPSVRRCFTTGRASACSRRKRARPGWSRIGRRSPGPPPVAPADVQGRRATIPISRPAAVVSSGLQSEK